MTTPDNAAELAGRVAAGQCDDEALRWLARGFAKWVRDGGTVRLDRCLDLPQTPAQLRRLRRDLSLLEAARELRADGPWEGAGAMKFELDKFLSGGVWRAWCELDEPPPGASRLRRALFWAAKSNDGADISRKHLSRIVGHIFAKKCPAEPTKLEALDHKEFSLNISEITRQARREWDMSARLREEFDKPEAYVAFRHAEARGLCRIYGGSIGTGSANAAGRIVASGAQRYYGRGA